MSHLKGRVTVPTDIDMIQETKEIVKRWGADALRDCDGTDMPEELKSMPIKIYSTYYTTRKDNAWANANPDEVQQVYLMTEFYTAIEDGELRIPIMKHLYNQQLKPNTVDDIKRWWEVVDRTTGEALPPSAWDYKEASLEVVVHGPSRYHDYTVSFLAFIIWDPVYMYNFITNDWQEQQHFITGDSGEEIQFGEGMKNVYALPGAKVIKTSGQDVQIAVHQFGKGRSVYLSGIPYSFENSRMLYRAIFWAAGREDQMKTWYSDNFNVEVNYYPATGKYCVVNNTYEPQKTVIYNGRGQAEAMSLKANDILWFEVQEG